MKILGALVFVFGLVDMIGSYTGFDIWTKMGIALPELIWRFSAWIALALGAFLFKQGSSSSEAA